VDCLHYAQPPAKLPKRCLECADAGPGLQQFEPWPFPRAVVPRRVLLKPQPAAIAPTPATRPMILPTDAAIRKNMPITSGLLDYFPLACAEVARLSKAGNDQHNPGQPMHWNREKSQDHADCIARHLIDRHARDTDGERHATKLAWRSFALLELVLEAEKGN